MKLISIQNIAKVYEGPKGGLAALQDVSLDIEAGEFLAITGASGSGKTTLLSILGAMNPPSHGKAIIDGIDIYSLSGDQLADFRRKYLGFVFQQQHLIPYLTAIENVMVPLVVSEANNTRLRTAAGALASVGLKDRLLQLPDQLSGGEQGRVAIARAVVNDPPILLADEPTGNLDSRNGEQIMLLLRALNARGRTIVMVTHSAEAAGFAHRTILLRDGRIVDEQQETTPAAPYVISRQPIADLTGPQWAEYADLAGEEINEDEDAEGDSDLLILAVIVIVGGVLLAMILFFMQMDPDALSIHAH